MSAYGQRSNETADALCILFVLCCVVNLQREMQLKYMHDHLMLPCVWACMCCVRLGIWDHSKVKTKDHASLYSHYGIFVSHTRCCMK